ncbi:translocation protein TolB [Planctomycetes bacterium Pan216]|uniref:Translocation protein TolB n=1 Tax=Kolteria novifilia TaxID=2527975 RepID=A0A518B3L0_9BACT|nr:translocation protein TolB [Planctomycetes bacterium Pan216]
MLEMLTMAVLAAPPGPPSMMDPVKAAKLEQRFLANPRQLTDDGKNGEGYFSPDSSKIIYQSVRGDHPFYQIYMRELGSDADQLISTGEGRTTCSYFHPTNGRVLFASSHLDPNRTQVTADEIKRLEDLRKNPPQRRSYSWSFDPYMDIFEANPDGTGLRRLTKTNGYDAEGAYSPDGKKIAFCSFEHGNGDIYVMDADGSNRVRLTDSPGYDGGPFFSPDGKRIIYRGEAGKPDYLQLFVMDADGSNQRQLTDNDAVNWGPYWHPDGKHIIFSTSLQGHYNYELYLMNVDTGEMARVTYMPGADVLPVFSPDGKKLLWTSKRGKDKTGNYNSELWIADWVMPPEKVIETAKKSKSKP